jgi:hypothetical protein
VKHPRARRPLLAALLGLSLSALAQTAPPAQAQAQTQAPAQPTVIRIGSPELGTGKTPFPGGNPLAVVKAN